MSPSRKRSALLLIIALVSLLTTRGTSAFLADTATASLFFTAATLEAPSALQCEFLSRFQVRLIWLASPTSGVEGYRIYHRGPFRQAFSLLDEVGGGSTTYDRLRPSFLHHRYYVTAFLGVLESGPSNTIRVRCRPRLRFLFPGPQNLQAENHHSQRSVVLTWEAVGRPASYVVLRATQSGGPYDIIATTIDITYTDMSVSDDITYYYLILALDAAGNESDPSEEVAVPDTVPIPTPTLTPTLEPTATPISPQTPTPTVEPTPEPTEEPTGTPIPTDTPTPTDTSTPTPTSTPEPIATPTQEASATLTEAPTAMPADAPSAEG